MITRSSSSSLLASAALCSSLLLSQASCNGYVPSAEPEPLADTCGPALVTAQVLPDQLTIVRVPAGNPLSGARLEIPAGSVPRPTELQLALSRDLSLEPEQNPLSRALCLRHNQGDFSVPAVLVLPLDKARYQRLNLTPHQVGFAAQTTHYSTPASPRPAGPGIQISSHEPAPSPQSAPLLPGIYGLDIDRGLAAIEIKSQGIYQLISRGKYPPALNSELDILFTIDNSGSMAPKQGMLARLFPRFFESVSHRKAAATPTKFANCVDWHLGTLTTDIGYDPGARGDDGKLQNTFCNQKSMSTEAKRICTDVLKCDNTLPMLKKPYLERDPMVDFDVQKRQFQCLLLAGDLGNGQERPLEAFSRFIKEDKIQRKSTLPSRTPFFRDRSLSVALFLTDESDCSLEASQVANFQKPYTACTTHAPECYTTNFRCYAMGLTCKKTPTLRSDFHGLGSYEQCTEASYKPMPPTTGMAGMMKSTDDFAKELRDFVVGPLSDGNLGRNGAGGAYMESFMLRAIVPHNEKRSVEIKDMAKKYTKEWQIDFSHSAADSPPSGADAFCSRRDIEGRDIWGHPEVRMKNFIDKYYLYSKSDDAPSDPLVEIRSICDSEDELAKALNGLADAVRKMDAYCPMTIAP